MNNDNNMMNPNMMNPGMMNPGMMNPTMMNPGMMNPGMGMGMGMGMDMTQGGGMIDPTAGMSVYKPTGSGTLLSDLVKDNEPVSNPYNVSLPRSNGKNNKNKRRYNLNHNQRSDLDFQYPQNSNDETLQADAESEYSNMRQLANDVNNSLQALEKLEQAKKRKRNTSSNATESDRDTESDHDDDEQHTSVENDPNQIILAEIESETDYLKTLTEILLLLTLYVIMSQPFVMSFASSYIHQLNPNEEGTISMTGIIIYGLILIIMFMVVRKVVFSRM